MLYSCTHIATVDVKWLKHRVIGLNLPICCHQTGTLQSYYFEMNSTAKDQRHGVTRFLKTFSSFPGDSLRYSHTDG